jgi:hypothetical protein
LNSLRHGGANLWAQAACDDVDAGFLPGTSGRVWHPDNKSRKGILSLGVRFTSSGRDVRMSLSGDLYRPAPPAIIPDNAVSADRRGVGANPQALAQ